MSDRETIEVEITHPKHIRVVWQLHGAAIVLDALTTAQKKHGPLPGLGMAVAIAEREVADLRAHMAGESLRAVSRAGHDICKYPEIVTAIKDDRPIIECHEPDLVDRAQEG